MNTANSPRRKFILARTETVRAKYAELEKTLAALREQESGYDYPCAALVRISDKIWDIKARMNSVHELLLLEGKLAASDWDNTKAAA